MQYVIEVLKNEIVRNKRLLSSIEKGGFSLKYIFAVRKYYDFQLNMLQQAIAHLQGNSTQPTIDNTGILKLPLNCFGCWKISEVKNCDCRFGSSSCQAWQLQASRPEPLPDTVIPFLFQPSAS
jgi:hypothetical protein